MDKYSKNKPGKEGKYEESTGEKISKRSEACNAMKSHLGESKAVGLIKELQEKSAELEKAKMIYDTISRGRGQRSFGFIIETLNWFGIPKVLAAKTLCDNGQLEKKEAYELVSSIYSKNIEVFGILRSEKDRMFSTVQELSESFDINASNEFYWSGIRKDGFGFLFAPAKAGKTIVLENLSIALLVGRQEFLGIRIENQPRKILFISAEEDERSRIQRIQKQIVFQGITGKRRKKVLNAFVQSGDSLPRLIDSDDDWKHIENAISKYRPELVIIDSLTRLYSGALEESKKAKQIGLQLRELAKRHHIALIVIHHTPKIGNKPLGMDSMAGSRVLAQEADFMLGLRKVNNGLHYLKEIQFRYRPTSEKVFTFKINENTAIEYLRQENETKVLSFLDGRFDTANTDILYDKICEFFDLDKPYVKTSELIAELVSTGLMSKQTLNNQLKKLVEYGKIVKVGRGRYALP